jgi:hypothetical protein
MKNFKIHFYAVLMLLTLTASCQNKKYDKKMNEPKFEYEGNICSPLGYPVDVYEGGLESSSGSTSLYLGVTTGAWGSNGGGMSHSEKAVPKRLNVTWLSYAEDTFYAIDCDIDYDKMVQLFKEGYQSSTWFFNDGRYERVTYNTIIVGFAPGGVVVVWLYGAGKQVEIGRYQGKKIVIPQSEIGGLDNHERLLFDAQYRKETMLSKQIVPLEVQEENKNKPIPYGLWDSYRVKYFWRPTYIVQQGGEMESVSFANYNAEQEELFDESFKKNEFLKRAIPKEIALTWHNKEGERFSGYIVFDEKEIFEAYKEIYREDKEAEAELEFRINIPNTFITVTLKSKNKELSINKVTKVRIFKIKKK